MVKPVKENISAYPMDGSETFGYDGSLAGRVLAMDLDLL